MPVANRPPVLISSGGLDTSFGGDGLTSTAIGVAWDQARGIAIQSDGKYVVAGWSDMGSGNYDFAVARFNTDGSLDTSFSGDGKQTTAFAGTDKANGMALQSDGKIVVVGTTTSGIDTDIALARYNTNGTLDTTFDVDGKVTLAGAGGASQFEKDDEATSVAIQSNGEIIVAGSSYFHYLLLRYNADGTLDTSFSGDGKVIEEFNNTTSKFNAIALQGDGKIIAAGYVYTGSYDFGVARYDTNGNIDTTFNTTGDKVFSLGAYEHLNAVAVQADGRILLAGDTGTNSSSTDAVLIRLNANGSFDTSFGGGDGIVTLDVSSVDSFNSLVVQADGKILAAGNDSLGFGEALVARFNADGTLDTSFSGDGVFSTPFGSGTSAIYGLAMAPSGQVVAAGDSFTGTYDIGMLRLASGVAGQGAISGSAFSYSVPAGAFFDPDGNPLIYTATLANGAALPAWLTFNAATHTFSGTPADGDFGTRQVKVTASDGSASVSANFQLEVTTSFIEALRNTDHSRWNDASPNGTPGTSLTFSFMAGAPSYGTANETSTFAPMTAAEQTAVRNVLQLYHDIAGVSFTEVADTGAGGQLRFGTYLQTNTSTAAYAYEPSADAGGDVWVNRDFAGYDTPASGNWSYETLLHEIGHALGLKHPGPYGSGVPPFLPAAVDNNQYTVMSYNLPADTLYRDVTGVTASDIHYFDVYDSTQMLYDVAAIQFLYGANTATRAGNDTYTFDPATPFFKTLWDGGGTDTISVSNFIQACVIDLREGHYSSIRILSDPLPPGFSGGTVPTYDGSNNLAIAFGCVIENATGGSGNDTLTGNAANNVLNGGAGADTLIGGTGNDTYIVDNAGDVVTEAAAAGTDLVQASVSYTLAANVENLTLTGAAAINGTGNTLANTLTGNAGNNVLDGGAGVDTLSYASATAGVSVSLAQAAAQITGGAGTDTVLNFENLTGSNFNDTLTGNAAANVFIGGLGNDTIDGGAGVDTASYSSATLAVVANLASGTATGGAGSDTLVGIENLTGSNFGDTLTGNTANNVLSGGTGADTLIGGAGNDTYVVDNVGDVVTEAAASGTDLVQASVSYTLAANVENLTLTGATAINGTGNALANTITGNAGNNVLDGGAGTDTVSYASATAGVSVSLALAAAQVTGGAGTDTLLNFENLTGSNFGDTLTGNTGNNVLSGGAGVDTMAGGTGNDTYVVDNVGDVVTEAAAAGTDLVQASVTYTLAANVENLTLTGAGAINGTGNTLANTITGNAGNNVITGLGGNDTLNGGAGADTLVGGAGADLFVFNSKVGADSVTDFVSGTDKFAFSQAGIRVGDGDAVIDAFATVAGHGGFATTNELVIVTANIAGAINATSAAADIGSAASAYAAGDTRLFAVDNGTASDLFLFTSSAADAAVSPAELTLVGVATTTPATVAGDYMFVA